MDICMMKNNFCFFFFVHEFYCFKLSGNMTFFMPVDLQPVEFFMQEKGLKWILLWKHKLFFSVVGCNKTYYDWSYAIRTSAFHFHYTLRSQTVFSFIGLEVNSRGKPKFDFHFGAIMTIILAWERKSPQIQAEEGKMYLFRWITTVPFVLDETSLETCQVL